MAQGLSFPGHPCEAIPAWEVLFGHNRWVCLSCHSPRTGCLLSYILGFPGPALGAPNQQPLLNAGHSGPLCCLGARLCSLRGSVCERPRGGVPGSLSLGFPGKSPFPVSVGNAAAPGGAGCRPPHWLGVTSPARAAIGAARPLPRRAPAAWPGSAPPSAARELTNKNMITENAPWQTLLWLQR